VYVTSSLVALVQEGAIGAVLCSLVILLFLGRVRMTVIAITTLPLAVLTAIVGLKATGQTINVMTLAGLTLAIGPMIDSAIICLENTHRHLALGLRPADAALYGASEVAMPELVSTLCTFLVLAPLVLIPGTGKFLFLPMMLAVMFAMTAAYILSRTLVPCASALLLKSHAPGHDHESGAYGPLGRAFARWERTIDRGVELYGRALEVMLRHKLMTLVVAFGLLVITLSLVVPVIRRDFFPEVDSGSFEIAVRAPSGTRIELTEKLVARVEKFIRQHIPKDDLEMIISEIGLTADWSAAYTANAGPMDAVVKVQLTPERHRSSQEYIRELRAGFAQNSRFDALEFSFESGGLVRSALNEGRASPINIQLRGKNRDFLFGLADRIKKTVAGVDGIVDARVLQRPDAPELDIDVNRDKAMRLGLTQDDIMKSVIAATNSSITYNKTNFWIDPRTTNQYYVGVQYPEARFQTLHDILNIPITSPKQVTPIPLHNLATIRESKIPTEIHHVNLQPAIDLTMNIEGRDLGHISDDVTRVLGQFGKNNGDRSWSIYDPWYDRPNRQFEVVADGKQTVARWLDDRGKAHESAVTIFRRGIRTARLPDEKGKTQDTEIVVDPEGNDRVLLPASKIILTGEYTRMQDTFLNLGLGLVLASLLIYFLMVALQKSWIVPLTVMLIVPLSLIGILPMLLATGSAVNVQSLLGLIFLVGIQVSNAVLMTDCAQEIRRHEGLTPLQAIRKAATLRARPVTMTALAAFCAMIPTALALERGSEANAPLARAILGGLVTALPATLFVLPALYGMLVRDRDPHGDGKLPDHGDDWTTVHG
jgi:multidrug efflux pump subunit AcrB